MPIYSLKDAVIHISDIDGRRGSNTVEVTVEEGDLSYTERRPSNIISDRGVLNHARKGNEEVVEVSFSIMYRSVAVDEDPSPYGAIKQVEGASAWVSTNHLSDKYGVDVEVILSNADGATADEYLYFTPFLPEEVAFNEGEEMSTLSFTGRALLVSPVSPDSAIQFYHLRAATAAVERDSGINNLDLTDNNNVALLNIGLRGRAKQFTAASSMYYSRADEANLRFGNIDYCGGAWVYITAETGSDEAIISKDSALGTESEMTLWYDDSENRFRFEHVESDGSVSGGASPPRTPALSTYVGRWVFVYFAHDAANDEAKIGYDGEGFGTPVATDGTGNTDTQPFRIGAGYGTDKYMNGYLSHVWVLRNKILTSAQMIRIFNHHRGQGFPLNY